MVALLVGPSSDSLGVTQAGLRAIASMAHGNSDNCRLLGAAGACEGRQVLHVIRFLYGCVIAVVAAVVAVFDGSFSDPALFFLSWVCRFAFC